MKKHSIEPNFFIRNRKAIIEKMEPHSVAIVLSNDEVLRNGDQNFKFRQSSDLFYLCGLDQEKTMLALCPDHPDEKLREVIFTIRPDKLMETWTGHKYTIHDVKNISGISTVKWLDDLEMTLKNIILHTDNIYLNLNEYFKYATDISYADHRFALKLRDQYPAHTIKRLAPLITEQRLIKKPEEKVLIQQACHITDKAFRRVLQFLQPGVMEYEIEAEIIHEFIRSGANGHAYLPIVGSGKNALTLHYIENRDECKDGDLLLMDFGAEYNHYAADCSRTIPVNGKFSKRQKQVYEAVLRIQKQAIRLYVPGNTIHDINDAVWKMAEKELIRLQLLTEEAVEKQDPSKPLYRRYLMHGVAHFIGLDVHDVGAWHIPLQQGMVLTCEPGIYIEEEGIGIRIEDDIIVGEPPVNLMASVPKEVNEIEELMKN